MTVAPAGEQLFVPLRSRRPALSRVLLFSPLLVAFLVVVPRLWSPQFGLLDDGHVLRLAPLASYSLYPGSGRFVPGYTLFYATVHAVVGTNPLRFFLANYAVMAVVAAGLIKLVQLRGGNAVEAWTAGVLLVLSGPAMENLYTLSKAEPAQVLWVVVSLLLMAGAPRRESRWRRAGRFAGTTTALLLAMTTKETAIVMIPISLGWLLVGWWCRDAQSSELAVRAQYVAASVAAGGLTTGLRLLMGAGLPSEGSYSGLYRFAWDSVRLSIEDWMVWVLRDFVYLVPLIVVIAALSTLKGQPQRVLLLDTVVWMIGWMAVYLPWSWIRGHYLLPFTLGAATFGGIAIGQALLALKEARAPAVRGMLAIGVGTFLILWSLTVVNNAGDAAVQLAIDAANQDMVRFAATLPSKSVLSVNMPNPSEYVYEIGVHLSDIEGRPDVTVGYFDSQALAGGGGEAEHYVGVPRLKHGVTPSFRSWVTEEGTVEWERAVTRALGSAREQVYRARRHVRLLIFNLHRPICEWWRMQTPHCRGSAPFIDTRVFSYGWDVYRVLGTRPTATPAAGNRGGAKCPSAPSMRHASRPRS